MQKVAIYCRLSDEDQNKLNKLDESESIQNQKNLLMKYALEKEWDIYKIYSDDDYSGLDKDRPEFNHMIKDAQAGKFEIILCKHQSRFSRDIEIIERYLHNKFPQWGIRFISLTDHVDTLEKGNKKSRQINSLVNEWYCEDISEAIRATFKIKREQGKFIGSFAPYGYEKDPKDKNKLIIDEEAAIIVRMIFALYLKGNGTQHIAYLLNEKRIPNPTTYKQRKGLKFENSSQTDGYGLWNKVTVRRILRNQVYIGNMVQGKREKVNYKSKKMLAKSQEDWIIAEDTHEPIIDEATFKAAQKRLTNRATSSGEGKAHIFATKLRCMDCGSTMNKVHAARGYDYLRCKIYARDPKKELCTSHSIRLDQLEKIVCERIRNHIKYLDNDRLAYRLKQEEELLSRESSLKQEREKIEKEISERNLVIKNLYVDKVRGFLSEEQFNELNQSFSREKAELEDKKNKVTEELEKITIKVDTIEKWVKAVKKYTGFRKLTHEMVYELIDYVEVGEKNKETGGQKIKIHWNF
ncbi:recombinase family protein [Anaerosolibacter sp.]|uniref:recombinase family protein n=1 Tax=Anaerosolibacter sp. TaxID=1872527 RepID=UPI0039F0BA2C